MSSFFQSELEKGFIHNKRYSDLTPAKKRVIRSIKRYNDSHYYEGKRVIPGEEIEAVLNAEYTDPEVGFKSHTPFFKHIRSKYVGISSKDVTEFLQWQNSHTIHKPVRRSVVKPILSSAPLERIQYDLAEMGKIGNIPGNPKFLLCIVDHYSKFAWVYPLKSKHAAGVYNALVDLFEVKLKGRKIKIAQSDNGKEFTNERVEGLLKEHGIKEVHSLPYKSRSQGLVERFNRTIKGKIHRYLTDKKESSNNSLTAQRFSDVLQQLVYNYNHTVHSTTGYQPKDLIRGKRAGATLRIKGMANKMIANIPDRQKIPIGSCVRINMEVYKHIRKSKFKKGYLGNWSVEKFKVKSVSYGRYQLVDEKGEIFTQRLMRNDLQKING